LRDLYPSCVALNVFALFHHVLPRKLQPVERFRFTPLLQQLRRRTQSRLFSSDVAVDVTATRRTDGDARAGRLFPQRFQRLIRAQARYYTANQTDTVRIAIDRVAGKQRDVFRCGRVCEKRRRV
jgi:hypothetical protein